VRRRSRTGAALRVERRALADFEEVTASLERWEDWCAAWSARAEVHARLGQTALKDGYELTAGEHFIRAAIYYHFAKFLRARCSAIRAAHLKAVECRQLALPHLRPPGERVEIPYEGRALAGILRKPEGAVRPPVLIMVPGLDSAKEELEAYELPFLARGMATLCVDGPGQGEAEYDFPIRGDYEVPVRSMVGWTEGAAISTQPHRPVGVTSAATTHRAQRVQKRIKACIGLAGLRLGACGTRCPTSRARRSARSHLSRRMRRGVTRRRSRSGGRTQDRVPALPRDRQARSTRAVAGRRADRRGSGGAGRAARRRGRQSHRQQPALSVPDPVRGLDGGRARPAPSVDGGTGFPRSPPDLQKFSTRSIFPPIELAGWSTAPPRGEFLVCSRA
jgi:hypothetical protein